MNNPDYPAIIKKKIFILDYDAFSSSFIPVNEIKDAFSTFNDTIYNLFEQSIKDDLREKMRDG